MAVTLPGAYDMIVKFGNIADPQLQWRSTYTFLSDTTPVLDVGIVLAIRNFAQMTIHSDSHMTGYDVYNWARGRQPYPLGSPVIATTGSLVGTADTSWTPLVGTYLPNGGEVCMRMDHITTGQGKPGRSFLRGLLGEHDVISVTGGKWTLVAGQAPWQTALAANVTSSGLGAYMLPTATSKVLCVVRYSAKLGVVHGSSGINQFQIIGVTTNKQTRKNKK